MPAGSRRLTPRRCERWTSGYLRQPTPRDCALPGSWRRRTDYAAVRHADGEPVVVAVGVGAIVASRVDRSVQTGSDR